MSTLRDVLPFRQCAVALMAFPRLGGVMLVAAALIVVALGAAAFPSAAPSDVAPVNQDQATLAIDAAASIVVFSELQQDEIAYTQAP